MTICKRGPKIIGSDIAPVAILYRKIAISGKISTKITSKLAVSSRKKKINGIKDAYDAHYVRH